MSQSELRFTFIHLSIQKGFMMNILKKITPKIFLVKEFYMRSTTAIKIFLIKKPSKLPVYILSEFLWKIYMSLSNCNPTLRRKLLQRQNGTKKLSWRYFILSKQKISRKDTSFHTLSYQIMTSTTVVLILSLVCSKSKKVLGRLYIELRTASFALS